MNDSTNSNKQAALLQETDYPPQIMLEVVNWCNLNCTMCPSSDLSRKRGIMEMDLAEKILDETVRESPDTKIWPAVMGEPLLAGERLFEILAAAQQRDLSVHLNTNAVLLTDYSIAQLKAYDVKEVIVGLDAATEDTYNKIRRNGDFELVKSNIVKMINAYQDDGPKLILQYIKMTENESETESFKDFWLAQGACVKIRLKQGWGDLVGSEMLHGKERDTPCPWLCRNCLVLWDGEVCQCDGDVDNQYSCGNVYKQSVKEIWQGEMRNRRKRHFNNDFDFKPCRDCQDWQVGLSQFYYPNEPNKIYTVDEKQ